MILHGIESQRWNNFHLFPLDEITGDYFTPLTSIIAIQFIWNKFHDLILGQPLKLSVSCDIMVEWFHKKKMITTINIK